MVMTMTGASGNQPQQLSGQMRPSAGQGVRLAPQLLRRARNRGVASAATPRGSRHVVGN